MANIKRPIIRVHNIETDEIIDREMDDLEFAEYKANLKSDEQAEAEIAAKQAERQAILDRLGLSADELKLILG